jgi:hypothetical protein
MMKALDENHWVPLKSEAIKEIIAHSGLFVAVAQNQEATPEALLN